VGTPTATTEKEKPPLRKRSIVQRRLPEPPPATPMSLSAAKAMTISAPLPDYPYQARRAHITGNGVCVMSVDRTSGRVTNALMAQSTGNALLDKITTGTFGQWRFKPGSVSQVQVPITYR
jgi:TonB family protein